jgi:hypothetical protein
MADAEDIREANAALPRKQRSRARQMWHKLQLRGYDSLEELHRVVEDLYMPATWAGRIGGRSLPDEPNVTREDLLPSKKAVETMIKNLSPEDKEPLRIDHYEQFLHEEAQEQALCFVLRRDVPVSGKK